MTTSDNSRSKGFCGSLGHKRLFGGGFHQVSLGSASQILSIGWKWRN